MATILILDDRRANREFLVALLSYAGYELLEAASAEEALALVRARKPDLVISDILMPEIDGFAFVRQIREDPTIGDTRVIFYSATYLESEARLLAQSCGVEHVLVKPADPEHILATVRLALAQQRVLATPAPPSDEFDRAHQRLLLNKLTKKVDELEALNSELEQRVATRTVELANANMRLNELNMFKDNLLAITAHDLRAPLGTIQHIADLLLDVTQDVEPRRLVQYVHSSARQMIDLVNKLLDLSRLESGKVSLDVMALRVSDVARECLEGMRFSAQAKTISTDLYVAPGEPVVHADPMKVSQIITNVLSNAIKFTPSGGTVSVQVRSEDGGVAVQIRDTGLGIPQDELPYLFDKFSLGHTYGTAGERGSGLGLAIVRQLVELHGGTIEVASEVQRGSIFTIFLPRERPSGL